MKSVLAAFTALACLLSTAVFAALPSSVKATYEMYRNNILFARVEETYTSQNGKYQIESSANPDGMLALVMKDRITRLSKGKVSKKGLQPEFFEEKRTSRDKEKVRSAQFD